MVDPPSEPLLLHAEVRPASTATVLASTASRRSPVGRDTMPHSRSQRYAVRADSIVLDAQLCTVIRAWSRYRAGACLYRAAMRQEDRLGLILQQLNEHGSVGVSGLADQLGVSEASVRRDLHLLEEQK